MVNFKSASFIVIMFLHEGLTHIQSQIKPRLLFGESFTLTQDINAEVNTPTHTACRSLPLWLDYLCVPHIMTMFSGSGPGCEGVVVLWWAVSISLIRDFTPADKTRGELNQENGAAATWTAINLSPCFQRERQRWTDREVIMVFVSTAPSKWTITQWFISNKNASIGKTAMKNARC